MVFESVFRCKCKKSKTNRVIFDGGSEGKYAIELCPKCYEHHDKKFLIEEEIISKFSLSRQKESIV